MEASDRIIIALDFSSTEESLALVDRLGDAGVHYKIGLQSLTAAGPELVRHLVGLGKQVFLDLKLFEIPTSVAGAVRAAGDLGVGMVTVHASAGSSVLEAAVRAAEPYSSLRVLALTVITSITDVDLAEIGIGGTVPDQVSRLARLAVTAGCDGVVAAPGEADLLARMTPRPGLIVTPGTQLEGESGQEHARRTSPGAAIRAGSTHLVIGRSISQAADPLSVLTRVAKDINEEATS